MSLQKQEKSVRELVGSIFLFSFLIFSAFSSFVFGEELSEPFSISVSINYLDFELRYVSGVPYIAWWIVDISPGDTAGMTDEEAVHLINRSNIPVDIFCSVFDNTDSLTIDTLWTRWKVGTVGGVDTMGFRLASYNARFGADIRDGVVILSSPILVESDLPVGENRFLYAWLLLPIEGTIGERHRLVSRITLTPSIGP